MANLQQIAHKFRISENYLNSKEDGLIVVAKSITDLINELKTSKLDENRKESIIEKMERLAEFCKEVKSSSF
jgi:ribosomal protein S15P/S13E